MNNKMKENAPKTQRNLLQVRLSDNEKRNIKMMAAGQGLTLREATLAAFTAWAEKAPRTGGGRQSGQSRWTEIDGRWTGQCHIPLQAEGLGAPRSLCFFLGRR
jgi:hypothetical protein